MTDAELQIVARLEEAGATLLALRIKGVFPAGLGSGWPSIVHSAAEAYGWETAEPRVERPSAAAIGRMDEAYGWVGLIPLTPGGRQDAEPWSRHGGAMLRRIVMLRSLVHPLTGRHQWSEKRIAKLIGASDETVGRWHEKAVGIIAGALQERGVVLAHVENQ